jgi:hypothetical protein
VARADVAASDNDADNRNNRNGRRLISFRMPSIVDVSLSYPHLANDVPGGMSDNAGRGWKYMPHDNENTNAQVTNASVCDIRAVLTSSASNIVEVVITSTRKDSIDV